MNSNVLLVILAIYIFQLPKEPRDNENQSQEPYEEAEDECTKFLAQADKEAKVRTDSLNNLIKYMKHEIYETKNLLKEANNNLEKSYTESEQTNILLNRILARL